MGFFFIAMRDMVKVQASEYFTNSGCYCFKFRYYPGSMSHKEIKKQSGYLYMEESYTDLKGLRNCILCIFWVWSLFCSVRVYTGPHFLSIFFC